MILILSPAKKLARKEKTISGSNTPLFHEKSIPLIRKLRRMSKPKLMELMNISVSLANLNADRYQSYCENAEEADGHPAILSFNGDAYLGLAAEELNQEQLDFANQHLRILSGLYGYLRPLDLIQPYRLEMGSKLKVGRKNNLYHYWKQDVTQALLDDLDLATEKVVINLASKEYASVIDRKILNSPIIDIKFREYREGKLRAIQFNLKRARGLMVRFAIDQSITKSEDLQSFNYEQYGYDMDLSDENNWYFTR
jgi:cytoplasmic iron level regulating protein YaaA (DUF328/UPF0246 family)